MKKVKVEITSIIKQEGQVEHFKCTGCGTLSCENDTYRIEYMEKNQSVEIPVKLLYKTDELIMQRGTIENNNYNMMKFMANDELIKIYLCVVLASRTSAHLCLALTIALTLHADVIT